MNDTPADSGPGKIGDAEFDAMVVKTLGIANVLLAFVQEIKDPAVVQLALYTAAVRYSQVTDAEPCLEHCQEGVTAAWKGLVAMEQGRAARRTKN